MQTMRALVAGDPRQFGRGIARRDAPSQALDWGLSDDARLFAATFVAGFLFVSILIG